MKDREIEKIRVLHALFIGGMLLLVWAMMILLFADKQHFNENRTSAKNNPSEAQHPIYAIVID